MDIDPVIEKRQHHLTILGAMPMVAVVIFAGAIGWFLTEWLRFNRREFNPKGDENTLDINYGFEDTVYVFLPLSIVCFILYLIGGSILVSGDVMVNNKTLTLVISIIPAVLGCVLLLNSGISFQNNDKIKKSYSDSTKKTSASRLKNEKVPYIDTAIVSLITGVVSMIILTGMLIYYYKVIDEIKDRIPTPVPSERYVKPNYLFRKSTTADPSMRR